MTFRRLRSIAVLGLVLSGLACSDFKALSSLAEDLRHEYGVAVSVNSRNDTELTITFPQIAIDRMKMDSAAAEAFARKVAVFTKAHYANSGRLSHINITSLEASSVGPLKITRTGQPYSYSVSELPDR